MANQLKSEQKAHAVSMLCEGSGIRNIGRNTGIHCDTIMRLGVRLGERTRFVAVLEIPPVESAETAVRVQIVKDLKIRDDLF